MGYSISYDTGGVTKVHKKSKPKRKRKILPGVIACGIAALLLFTDFKQLLWDIFLPGAGESTQAAFSQMISDLRAGDSIQDAVSAFCMEILEDVQPEN